MAVRVKILTTYQAVLYMYGQSNASKVTTGIRRSLRTRPQEIYSDSFYRVLKSYAFLQTLCLLIKCMYSSTVETGNFSINNYYALFL